MRYFLNTSAAKPIAVGGITFVFELVGLQGGSWLGILAVEDDSAASVLSGAPNTEEIPLEKFDELKKKARGEPSSSNSPRAPQPPTSPHLAIADHVGRPTALPVANPVQPVTPITLLTTRHAPPVEHLLAPGHRMSRPK